VIGIAGPGGSPEISKRRLRYERERLKSRALPELDGIESAHQPLKSNCSQKVILNTVPQPNPQLVRDPFISMAP
jgi:hypothetical protein